MIATTESRIYVACLSAYNNGYLHGAWIDACQDAEQIREEITEMLSRSPMSDAEEWAIHDYEGFGNFRLSESHDLERVSECAQAIEEHGFIIADLCDHLGGSIEDAKEYMSDNYQGEFDDLEAYADHLLEETGEINEIPKNLRYYFDMKSYGRDLELNGDIFTLDASQGNIHVFWNQ